MFCVDSFSLMGEISHDRAIKHTAHLALLCLVRAMDLRPARARAPGSAWVRVLVLPRRWWRVGREEEGAGGRTLGAERLGLAVGARSFQNAREGMARRAHALQ